MTDALTTLDQAEAAAAPLAQASSATRPDAPVIARIAAMRGELEALQNQYGDALRKVLLAAS